MALFNCAWSCLDTTFTRSEWCLLFGPARLALKSHAIPAPDVHRLSFAVVHAGVNAVSAALALLVSSAGHDAMHSVALRLVLSPSILPQIAQPRPDEVIICPQQHAIRSNPGDGDIISACRCTADAPKLLVAKSKSCFQSVLRQTLKFAALPAGL